MNIYIYILNLRIVTLFYICTNHIVASRYCTNGRYNKINTFTYLHRKKTLISIRTSTNCSNGYLEVRDGGDANAPLMARLCGYSLPDTLHSR